MCGIYGRLDLSAPRIAPEEVDRRAIGAIAHRGPDDEGSWYGSRVYLGMRRLSVIDLTTGHQPIFNEDQTVCVVYNGEIYNFAEVRRELEGHGHRFSTSSDTEVIVHGWEQWGEGIADRLNGMFAFALWDERIQALWLVRDRLGIKPLYYCHQPGRQLVFASEIKSILARRDVPREIDRVGLLNFFAYGHAIAPRTMYQGIRKLQPGHSLRIERSAVTERAWWTPSPAADDGTSDEEWARRVRELLEDSVRRQMIADVPVGAFLSGGVDSSAVVALMARNTNRRVKTFAVGFEYGSAYNELPDARLVANHIGTEHHEIVVRAPELLDALQTLVYHFDEPFGDAACFPTYLVSRLARQHVTVALTGVVGYELFGGYRRYVVDLWLHRMAPVLSLVGPAVRPVVGALPRVRRLKKLLDAGGERDDAARYAALLRVFTDDQLEVLLGEDAIDAAFEPVAIYREHFAQAARTDHRNRLMYADLKTWLPDTYLEKVDKSSMAVSLEARVPLLDHRLVELSLRIPSRSKIANGGMKRVFKRAIADLLPPATLQRAKHGFAVPTDPWFRGELRQFAFDVLFDPQTKRRGYFRSEAVEALWREHQDGRHVRDAHLWLLMNFELWARRFLDVDGVMAA
jgi:asparagine synthase (glutamine-hydrolysing)